VKENSSKSKKLKIKERNKKLTIYRFRTKNTAPSTTTLNFAIPLTFEKGEIVNVALESTFAEVRSMLAKT
jgi:hypothetical protein